MAPIATLTATATREALTLTDSAIVICLSLLVAVSTTIGVQIMRQELPYVTRLVTLGVTISAPILAILVGVVLL
jgi:hypothetical protein